MNSSVYEIEHRVEASHWWFVVRRRLFRSILEKMNFSKNIKIVDVGSSTGTNLRLLKEMGFRNVSGLDTSPDAIQFCHEKGLGPVVEGSILNAPFETGSVDLVLATDVIEHLEDDLSALREVGRILTPDGKILITVPAFSSLWGLQDEVSHHKRRYRMKQLVSLVEKADLKIRESFYFNYFLFVPIWLMRQVIRISKIKIKSENELNSPLLNHILKLIFAVDVATAGWLLPPFGVSILVIAEK